MEDKISKYNYIFSNTKNIELIEDFKLRESSVNGSIRIKTSKKELLFDVVIPLGFPLGKNNTSIRFIVKNIKGYEHQNTDKSICLHPEADIDLEKKLKGEIDLLFEWIEKYYIQEKRDSNYVYLQHKSEPETMIFDDIQIDKSNKMGVFSFIHYQPNTFLALNIGGKKCNWASHFHKFKEKFTGLWIYIEKEPIINKAQIVLKWSDLQQFFSKEQINFVYNYRKNKQLLFLMLGYTIPNSNEIHWEMIKIDSNEQIIKGVKYNNRWVGEFTENNIKWCRTINSSYNRFFGRGKLSEKLTEKSILIIGVGAIGSSLAMILTRGGVKKIDIVDYDIVESGNICRSEYFMDNISIYKSVSLFQLITHISPFIDVNILESIEKTLPDTPNHTKNKELLKKYDIIFDCSTDMEMSYMLDKMNLKSEIYNLSITDMAKEFVCVYGRTNITKQKTKIFNDLNTNFTVDSSDFYPELGCGYPTFKANYNDINTLLNFAIKTINHKYDNNFEQSSFILRTESDAINFKIEVDEK